MDERPYRNRKPRFRAARRRELRSQGETPANRQWAWCVRPAALLELPDWVREAAVKGLGLMRDRAWLWPVDAKRLIRLDRGAGGRSEVTIIEVRHCGLCARPLIGAEAERRRKLDEQGPQGREMPCGDGCRDDRRTGIWKRLAPSFRTRPETARTL